MTSATPEKERIARCSCGSLRAAARGEPADVYACGCIDCQRRTGSAFSYAALYPVNSVAIAGEFRTWRRQSDFGRMVEHHFCPTCGTTVFFHAEGLPGLVGIAAGCFAEPDFAQPVRLYWASRRLRWLDLPAAIELIDTQPK